VAYVPGDRFIICSDGLVDGLWDRHIEEIVKTTPVGPGELTAAQRLVNTSVENSGKDNVTAVVVEISESKEGPPCP